jgi:hypothetical protein
LREFVDLPGNAVALVGSRFEAAETAEHPSHTVKMAPKFDCVVVLWEVARVVHEADLADDRYDEPTAAGLDTVMRGMTLVTSDDAVLQVSAVIFDGLYEQRRAALRGST